MSLYFSEVHFVCIIAKNMPIEVEGISITWVKIVKPSL